jgi:citronellyl-CoA dehydrogenase
MTAGHKGISFVTFPTDVKGYSVGKKLKKVGNLASDTAELFFDDCRIPARYLVGEKNRGFYYVMENFQGERLAAAIQSVASQWIAAIDYAVQYGKDRQAFGRPFGSMQVWRHRVRGACARKWKRRAG